jgi:two-component system response regulator WspF
MGLSRMSNNQSWPNATHPSLADEFHDRASPRRTALVVIGASAGGPAALTEILRTLPTPFPAPIVIVQHVDAQFAVGMAEWLSISSPVPVRIARAADRPTPGTVLMAGTDEHLVFVTSSSLGYVGEPRELVYRPSIDVFFQSVLRYWTGAVVGVLLTGMGRDGAQGLKALRDAGAFTIAQDRESSAVYGMPNVAALLDAATEILPLDNIGLRVGQILQTDLPTLRR